ncbi:MAG: hypothetical protein IJL92_08165, partial [Thermoguttaceae bacterium]|nr:hypothetical protein [Thermoguttaceae bacterium]
GFGAPQFGGPRGGQPGFGAPQFGGPRGGQPGFGAPQFGGPRGGQPGFGGPRGGQPGFGGPRGGQPGFGGPQGPGFFGDAFKDGKLELSKLPEQTPQGIKDNLKNADKDSDGFLSEEEFKAITPPWGFHAPQFGAPMGGQPGFGGPQGPGFFGDAFKDGKLELSKLPEQTPQGIKDNLKNADKDSDGFLSEEEFKAITPPWGFHAPQFGAPMGGQPEFNKPNHEDSKEPHEEAEQN